jgi:hypothetical protein
VEKNAKGKYETQYNDFWNEVKKLDTGVYKVDPLTGKPIKF